MILFYITEVMTVAVSRRMNIVSEDYNGKGIPGDECGLNFQTCLTVEENPGKTSIKKLTRLGIEPGPAGPYPSPTVVVSLGEGK